MGNYYIIGGDGKQYGPVTEAELRKWIAEGRLSQQSQAKEETDTEFRPLSAFPELADAFAAPAPLAGVAPVLGGANFEAHDEAVRKVMTPAIGLIVSGILSIIMSIWGLIQLLFIPPNLQQIDTALQPLQNPQLQDFMHKMIHFIYGPFGIANDIFQLVIAVLILLGALKMKQLRSYEFAFAAAILSVLPCITPCCGWILGLIFGIWAMVVLAKPGVKSQFN